MSSSIAKAAIGQFEPDQVRRELTGVVVACRPDHACYGRRGGLPDSCSPHLAHGFPLTDCVHENPACLNQYELIRKYRCATCSEVMMCACDSARGGKHLAHQLREGSEYGTRARVPVTLGFQPNLCTECRGLPAVSAPAASIPGRTSKVQRYYWRELFFEKQERFAQWQEGHPHASPSEETAAWIHAEAEALAQIKKLHAENPKYDLTTESEASFLKRLAVQVEEAHGENVGAGQLMLKSGAHGSAEEYAAALYADRGYIVLPLESRPLHVLFGAFMWTLIEDIDDPLVRSSGLDRRPESTDESLDRGPAIWTLLPEDFGTCGYAARRAEALEEYFQLLPTTKDELLWLFDYSLEGSERLRQYLWAHETRDVNTARALVQLLQPPDVRTILTYLVANYWRNYLGWPDLLLFKDRHVRLVEVKLGPDKLSDEQRHWIVENQRRLGFDFSILKIHRRPVRS